MRKPPAWSDTAIARLRDGTTCPVCGRATLVGTGCRACGADLGSAEARELWNASQHAADALMRREGLRLVIPRTTPVPTPAQQPTPIPRTEAPPAGGTTHSGANTRRSATLQSVLAIAGVGLFAVAALVFTFFNPDLTDTVARGVITAVVTMVFAAVAWALQRRGLRASSEAAGALTVVFMALDIYTVAVLATPTVDGWVATALATTVAGTCLVVLGTRVRLRVWFGAGVLALAFVPVLFVLASTSDVARVAGGLTTGAAAMALIVLTQRLRMPFESNLRAEVAGLTGIQLVTFFIVLAFIASRFDRPAELSPAVTAVALAVLAAIARLSSRRAAVRLWSLVAGAMTAASGAVGLFAVGSALYLPGQATLTLVTAGSSVGLLLTTVVAPLPSHQRQRWSTGGALTVTGLATLSALVLAGLGALESIRAAYNPDAGSDPLLQLGTTGAVAASALGLALYAVATRTKKPDTTWAALCAAWLGGAAMCAFVTIPQPSLSANVAVGVVAALAVAGAAVRAQRAPRKRGGVAIALATTAHALLATTVALVWSSPSLAAVTAPALLAGIAAAAMTMPGATRWLHLGTAYGYALIAAATALQIAGMDTIAVTSLTTCAAALTAIAATHLRALGTRSWWTILIVTSLPFALGVLQVVRERSGWTALSTGLIFLLALTLVASRRRGMVPAVRALSAAVLVPSLAVVIICLGAQFLEVSASPVTLPLIAIVVAISLLSVDSVARALDARGLTPADTRAVRWSIEVSTLVTGAIAVGLSLTREAAGVATALIVLLVLSVGAGIAALRGGGTMRWWFAAVSATGASWCGLQLVGADLLELYTVPPSMAAVAVGATHLSTRRSGRALMIGGLAAAVSPSLAMLALRGGEPRAATLLVAGAVALAVVGAFRAKSATAPAVGRVLVPILWATIAAAAAGPIQAARWGLSREALPDERSFWACLAISGFGGLVAAGAGLLLARLHPTRAHTLRHWLLAPAIVYVVSGAWPSISPQWPTIWAMWGLALVVLGTVVAVSVRPQRPSLAPPIWLLFTLGFVTSVVAWSPRELRVEWFSLPLGAALLLAGAVHLTRLGEQSSHAGERVGAASSRQGTISSWPFGWRGSWSLLLPGILTIMSASIVATFTDPLTWRAILVIVLALVAILVGARAKLAAPFMAGLIVLPIENVSAFSVQIGRGIESMPWWITLAAVGAVLLIIAVSYERQASDSAGISARLRDLA